MTSGLPIIRPTALRRRRLFMRCTTPSTLPYLPDHSLDSTATINIRAENSGADRLLIFHSFPFAQCRKHYRRRRPSSRVLPESGHDPAASAACAATTISSSSFPNQPRPSAEFSLRFRYRGNIIDDAGNDVLFVGARESWYPHLGDSADFAMYDLTMRWPRKLRLIATGDKIDEHEDGEFRVGHWQTETRLHRRFQSRRIRFHLRHRRPIIPSTSTPIASSNRNCKRLEPPGVPRSAAVSQAGSATAVWPHDLEPLLPPSPAAALKQLGKEIDSSIHFYESFSGPFPFRTLSVSQIPGTFGQGWPGLLYVSTYSFLSTEAQHRAGLSSTGQEHFTEIVPFHEVAHQWWGNVVGWSSYRDQWIDEAIANYLALLFADTRKNPDHTLRVWLQRYRQQLVEKAPSADEPASESARSLSASVSIPQNPRTPTKTSFTPKAPGSFTCCAKCCASPDPIPTRASTRLLHTLVTKYAYRALIHAGSAARSRSRHDSRHGPRRRPFHGMVFRTMGARHRSPPLSAWNFQLTRPTTAATPSAENYFKPVSPLFHRPRSSIYQRLRKPFRSPRHRQSPPAPKPLSTSLPPPPPANS